MANLLSTTVNGQLNTGNVIDLGYTVNGSIATTAFRGINFHSFGDLNYYIGKPSGSWTQPLHIHFYTGVWIRSHHSYGGTRFYNIATGSNLMSIGDGADNINVYAKITSSITSGTVLSHGSMDDAIGWNSSYGTYIGSTVGGTSYLYANGTLYTGGAFRTLIHSGNIASQSVSYADNAGNLGGLSSGKYPKQDYYYSSSQDWNTIEAADTASAIVLRIESAVQNPPANDVYNWSLWQQGTRSRGSQIAVAAYGAERIFFRGSNFDTGSYHDWNEIIHSGNIGGQSVSYASSAGNSATTSQIVFSDLKTNFPSGVGGGHSFASNHYSMGLDVGNGAWSHPHYRDVIIGYHTGIRIGANYSGIRFYNNSPTTDANNDGNGDGGEALLMTIGGYVGTANQTDVVVNNNLFANVSMRAPIFYDSQDTGYYGNFAGFSRMSEVGTTNQYVYNYDSVESGRTTAEFGSVGKYVATRNAVGDYPSFSFEHVYGTFAWGQIARFHIRASGQDRPSIQFSSGSSNDRWNIGFCTGVDNNFRISQNMGYRPDNSGVSDGWGIDRFRINTDGSIYISSSLQAYSYQGHSNVAGTGNASYHPSGIYSTGTNWLYGTMYMNNNSIRDVQEIYNNGWFRTVGHQGLYNPTNDAHFYPNNASYGSWRIDGTRNGWHGIYFGSGATLMMNSGETGIYRESYGWQFRWYQGEMYISPNTLGGGTERTVIHSGNIGSQSVSYASSAGGVSWGNVTSKPSRWLGEANLIYDNAPDTAVESGFWQSYLGSGNPTGTWFNYINVRHSNTGNVHGYQLGMSYYDNNLWFRSYQGNGTYQSWSRALGTNTDPYPSNMNQYVRTTDDVTHNSTTSPTFVVNNHSDNTKGYRIHNTSGSSVSAMFTNSSNQLVIAAGAVDQINLNKKVYVNGVALGVNVTPSSTAGRIDASNDIVAYSSSDERLKYNITPIENAIDKVKSLTGVEFDWKPEYKHAHGYEGHDTGIIAQQVQEVIPSAVRTNDTGFLAVRYEKLIGLLIEANKELAARVEELEKKLG